MQAVFLYLEIHTHTHMQVCTHKQFKKKILNLNKKSCMEGIGRRGRKRENEIIIMLKIKIKNDAILLIRYTSCCSDKKKISGKSNLWSQGFALAHNWIVRSIKGIIAAL